MLKYKTHQEDCGRKYLGLLIRAISSIVLQELELSHFHVRCIPRFPYDGVPSYGSGVLVGGPVRMTQCLVTGVVCC